MASERTLYPVAAGELPALRDAGSHLRSAGNSGNQRMNSLNGTTLREWLHAAPFSLAMSSGFFSFYVHLGLLSMLEEEQLIPIHISGASAGALVGSCFAAGMTSASIASTLIGLRKEQFWDPGFGPGLLRGEKFRALLRSISPVERIERCPIPLAISTYSFSTGKTKVFRHGDFSEVVYASCALPVLFQPGRIGKRWYWDGGIKDRHGLAGAPVNDRVLYHHISSLSPWRSSDSESMQLPDSPNIISLCIDGLPRCGPNRLAVGEAIFKLTRRTIRRALDAPIEHNSVRLRALQTVHRK